MVRKVLLVDDDIDDHLTFRMALKHVDTGIDCVVATDGTKAIEELRPDRGLLPDYIFMDVNMPKMNGIDCLRGIRQMPHLHRTKIYVYTTASDKDTFNKSTRAGATGFIVKPNDLRKLVDMLKAIFR